jgi:hypothetical protein
MRFEFTLKDTEKENFALALKILSSHCKSFKEDFICSAYHIVGGELYLIGYKKPKLQYTALPYHFNLDQTIEFAWGWWQNNQKPKDEPYGGDGSIEVAYEITTIYPDPYTFNYEIVCKIKPIWFYYGK